MNIRILAVVTAAVMMIALTVPISASRPPISGGDGGVYVTWTVEYKISGDDITDERLAQMVRNGEIPHNVEYLDLNNTRITNLSPVAGLPNLRFLDVSNNRRLRDISVLRTMTNLEHLRLFQCRIKDVSPLANLTNLHTLDLRYNGIIDFSPLDSLPNLEWWRFDEQYVPDSDGFIIYGWNSAASGYYLEHNMTDEMLAEKVASGEIPPNITDLYINNGQLTDLSPLAGLTDLIILSLEGNLISDISPLSGLTELRVLDLNFNQISDVSPLSRLRNLEQLNLNLNKISDVTPLAELRHLELLRLAGNQIDDVSPLAKLTDLWVLELSGNQIEDFSALDPLKKLTWSNYEHQWFPPPDTGVAFAVIPVFLAGAVMYLSRRKILYK
jgi:internalin A